MDEEKIILAVRKRGVLYDRDHPKYSNRDVVRVTWEKCAEELGIEAEYVKSKWCYLRDYFVRQHRTRKFTKHSPGHKNRKWRLYDLMSFLIPHLQQRKGTADDEDGDAAVVKEEGSNMAEFDDPEGSNSYQEDVQSVHFGSLHQTAEDHVDVKLNILAPFPTPASSHLVSLDNSTRALKRAIRDTTLLQRPLKRSPSSVGSCDGDVPSTGNDQEEMDDHQHFVLSLLPMMRRLDSVSALEFRIDVQTHLLRYLTQTHSRGSTTTGTSPKSPANT